MFLAESLLFLKLKLLWLKLLRLQLAAKRHSNENEASYLSYLGNIPLFDDLNEWRLRCH
jgi:hypothetical protein